MFLLLLVIFIISFVLLLVFSPFHQSSSSNFHNFYKDKVVWITGASSGIGKELAIQVALCGGRVVLSSRNAKDLEIVRQAILQQAMSPATPSSPPSTNQSASAATDKSPIFPLIIPLDLDKVATDDDYTKNIVKQVIDASGCIDILVNNAGIGLRSSVVDSSNQVDRQLFNVNYFGATFLTKAVLPYMIKRKSGIIGVISSVQGMIATGMRASYTSSKFALHGYFQALAHEVYDDNISVSIVCPGYVNTGMSLRALTKDGKAYNKKDEKQSKGLSADYSARQTLSAIAHGQRMVIIADRLTNFAVYLQFFAPSVLFNILIRRTRNSRQEQ